MADGDGFRDHEDLPDVRGEPEPDWVEGIRRGREERAKRLRIAPRPTSGRRRGRRRTGPGPGPDRVRARPGDHGATSMSHVFHRVLSRPLPRAVRAEGVWIEDAEGRRYLDGAGGAIVVNVGHGDPSLGGRDGRSVREDLLRARDGLHDRGPRVVRRRASRPCCPWTIPDLPGLGWERGGRDRDQARPRVPSRPGRGVAHTGDRAARLVPREHAGGARRRRQAGAAASVRAVARAVRPRGRRVRVPLSEPRPPAACGAWHAERLDRAIVDAGPSTVAAFIAEPVAGATLAAAVPTDDYWPAVAEVCRRHGVLLIADEVMTGFGRTGRWFGVDHWGCRPDVVTVGKGSTSGVLPVRVRRRVRARCRDGARDRVRPRVHRGRTTASARRSPTPRSAA